MRSPFKFLDAYTLADKNHFFGREKEVEELYEMVFRTPLILVYGPSGTGKTSLVQCGLASRFEGPDWNPFFIRRKDDINNSIREAFRLEDADVPTNSIVDAVGYLFQNFLRPVYLIFDQFEELFILGNEEEQHKFSEDIQTLLHADLPCKVILVMREEYIGHLYSIEKSIPKIFDFRLRVEQLNAARVTTVIQESCAHFKIDLEPPGDELTQSMIDNITSDRLGIQLPFLQVYLDMIYRNEYIDLYGTRERGHDLPSIEFKKKTVEEIGVIDNILEKFLDERSSEIQHQIANEFPQMPPDTIDKVLDAFVSEEGTKRPIPYEFRNNILEFESNIRDRLPQISSQQLTRCFQLLEVNRLLHSDGTSIELAHDALADIIDQNRSDEQRHLNEIRKRIKNNYVEHLQTGEFLSQRQLAMYEEYFPALSLADGMKSFVERSREHTLRQQKKEDERREQELLLTKQKLDVETKARRRQKVLILLLSFVAGAAVILGFWAQDQRKNSEDQKRFAEDVANIMLWADIDLKEALRIASEQFKIDPKSPLIAQTIKVILRNEYPLYKNIFYHSEIVGSIAISPTGDFMVTCDWADSIHIWDDNGHLKRSFKGHEDRINDIIFTNDGKKIISVSSDNTAKLWSLNGDSLGVFVGHEGDIVNVAISKTGNYIVTASWDKTANLWSQDGVLLQTFTGHQNFVSSVAISSDAKTIVTGSWDGKVIAWNQDGTIRRAFDGHDGSVSSVTLSPDDRRILSGGWDDTISIWDLETGISTKFIANHGEVTTIGFDLDGNRIVSGGTDGVVRIWNLDGEILFDLEGHSSNITSVSYSHDNNYVVSSSWDQSARVWVPDRHQADIPMSFQDYITALKHTADGEHILVGRVTGEVDLVDLATKKVIWNYQHDGEVTDLDYSTNLKVIASCGRDQTIQLHGIDGQLKRKSSTTISHDHTSIAFSPDGLQIYTANARGHISIWDTMLNETGRVHHHLYTTGDLNSDVNDVKISEDGKYVVSAAKDGTAKVWGVTSNTLKHIKTIIHSYDSTSIHSVDISADGKFILTAGENAKGRLWNRNGDSITTFTGHSGAINKICFMRGVDLVVTGSADRSVILWNLNGNRIQTIETKDGVLALTIPDDGKVVIYGGKDKRINTFPVFDAYVDDYIQPPIAELATAPIGYSAHRILLEREMSLQKQPDERIEYFMSMEYYNRAKQAQSAVEELAMLDRCVQILEDDLELVGDKVDKFGNFRSEFYLDSYCHKAFAQIKNGKYREAIVTARRVGNLKFPERIKHYPQVFVTIAHLYNGEFDQAEAITRSIEDKSIKYYRAKEAVSLWKALEISIKNLLDSGFSHPDASKLLKILEADYEMEAQ